MVKASVKFLCLRWLELKNAGIARGVEEPDGIIPHEFPSQRALLVGLGKWDWNAVDRRNYGADPRGRYSTMTAKNLGDSSERIVLTYFGRSVTTPSTKADTGITSKALLTALHTSFPIDSPNLLMHSLKDFMDVTETAHFLSIGLNLFLRKQLNTHVWKVNMFCISLISWLPLNNFTLAVPWTL